MLDIQLGFQMQTNSEGFCVYEKGNQVNFSISARNEIGRPTEGGLVLCGDGVTLWGTYFYHPGTWASDEQAYAELAEVALRIARNH